MLSPLRRWLADIGLLPFHPETSRLIVGSTGSGKSEGELVDLVRLADRGDYAVVLLDGHGPLAFRTAAHWAAHGHEQRMIYEPLRATDRVLCWSMLPRSTARSLSDRLIDNAETRDETAQCFLAQRNLATLNDKPWTKEWLDAAIGLCLSQPGAEPLPCLLHAFQIGSVDYERLLRSCEQAELVAKFRALERLKRKSIVQYELQTGPARRLLELVCTSEVVRLRARPGPFDWLAALQERKLIAFDGGGLRSTEIKRTLFLLVSLQVIQAVRRHFALTQQPLPVVLVLEEAGALDLVSPFVRTALQELRKAGLALHIITQSCLDFGERAQFEALLSHIPWQAWYQVLSPADQELGARALTNMAFDALAVHYTRDRVLHDRYVPSKTVSRGKVFDPERWTILQRDQRTSVSLRTKYKHVAEAYYKAPQLQEQEYRTSLATLRIGERLVRDRRSVWSECVTLLKPPRRYRSDAAVHALIARLREQPIYQVCTPPEMTATAVPLPDAAARLNEQARR